MKQITYSTNRKTNNLLCAIQDQLLKMCDTEQSSLDEIRHYMTDYPQEPDYNIADHGNLMVYYVDIRKMYLDCGYKSLNRVSNDAIWQIYRSNVGYVATRLVNEHINA